MIDEIYAAPKFIQVEQGIDFAVKNGLNYEIPSFLSPKVLDNKNQEVAHYRQLLQGFRGTLSLHGPVIDLNPVSLDPYIAQNSRLRYAQAIEATQELGGQQIIFHSQYTPIFTVANVYKEWLAQSVDYWQEVIETQLKGSDLTILMENFMDESPQVLYDLVTRVNSPHLKICLDTGHVNLFSKIDPIDWLDALGNHVTYIHAHNNEGVKDDHHAFHHGTIDMDGFLNHLSLLPNPVSLAIEVFDMEGVQQSYDMLQPFVQAQEEQVASKSFIL